MTTVTINNNEVQALMIGGQALRTYGHDRHTLDTDYLVFNPHSNEMFLHDVPANVDYINVNSTQNGSKFFNEIWKMESKNTTGIATLNAIAEMKAFSFVQNCINRDWAKADAAEYDLKFMARNGAKLPTIVAKYVTAGQFSEIVKLWK